MHPGAVQKCGRCTSGVISIELSDIESDMFGKNIEELGLAKVLPEIRIFSNKQRTV